MDGLGIGSLEGSRTQDNHRPFGGFEARGEGMGACREGREDGGGVACKGEGRGGEGRRGEGRGGEGRGRNT